MPRCYMVKKDPSPLGGTPPCSPTEASVAPPCYTPHDHHSRAGPHPAHNAEPLRHVATQCEGPRSGDYAEKRGGTSTSPRGAASRYDHEPHNGIYTVLRAAEYTDPHYATHCPETTLTDSHTDDATWCDTPTKTRQPEYDPRITDYSDPRHQHEPRIGDYAEPRTVRYLERDFSDTEPRAAEYAEPRSKSHSEDDKTRTADYGELHKYEAQVEYSAGDDTKAAEYAELQNMGTAMSERSAGDDTKAAEYAELQSMGTAMSERSAADTEAAHELLSLAASVPPLPPATVLTVLGSPDPVLPVYTYAIQPTNIYIIADEPANHNLYATAVQTLTPLQQVEYSSQPQVSAYITYQEPVCTSPLQYQPLYEAEGRSPEAPAETGPIGVPVSVIEMAPAASVEPAPLPLSVQVPVIEAVPLHQQQQYQHPIQEIYDTDSDESAAMYINIKKNKYNCNECGKRYATSSNLSRHKQTHRSLDSQAAKRCSECGKAYVSMPALAMHVLTHRMGYVCGVCGKQFSRPWLLRGHLRSHTGEKPYNCTSCSKSFADRSNLRAHLQTHASDKRWECVRCYKTFALKSYLNKHQEAACSPDDQDAQ